MTSLPCIWTGVTLFLFVYLAARNVEGTQSRKIDCGWPGPLQNGWIEGHKTTVGSVISFKCHKNFVYVGQGSHRARCRKNGKWSIPLPECHGGCRVPFIFNGNFGSMRPNSLHEHGVIASPGCCNGYVLKHRKSVFCVNGKWSHVPECVHPEIKCEWPGPLWNGFIQGEKTTVGSVISFICHSDTTLKGERRSSYCMKNGQWSNLVPQCLAHCRVPAIHYGEYKGKSEREFVKHGTVIEPTCRNGLFLNDKRPVTCNNGTWTHEPRCISEIDCGWPGPLWNGWILGHKTTVGSVIYYRCHKNTIPPVGGSSDKAECLENGQWSKPAPICLGHCQVPSIWLANLGGWRENALTEHGTVIKPTCCGDLVLSDTKPMECQNGTWTHIPKCVPRIGCEPFGPLWNGHIYHDEETHIGAYNIFKCNKLTTFKGESAFSKCLENGTWTFPHLPQCLAHCRVPSIYKGNIRGRDENEAVEHGTAIEATCDKGRFVNDVRPAVCNNGTWDHVPRCITDKNQECKSPPEIDNAVHDGPSDVKRFELGANVTYTCNDGYTTPEDSSDIAKCTRGSRWVGATITCTKPCDHPPNITDGYRKFLGTSEGSKAVYYCDEGFKVVGMDQEYMECRNETWVGGNPACKQRMCPPSMPGKLQNGQIFKVEMNKLRPFNPDMAIEDGETILYTCDKGHGLLGPRYKHCVLGEWSTLEQPECLPLNNPGLTKQSRSFEVYVLPLYELK